MPNCKFGTPDEDAMPNCKSGTPDEDAMPNCKSGTPDALRMKMNKIQEISAMMQISKPFLIRLLAAFLIMATTVVVDESAAYQITLSAGTGGNVDPSGTLTVNPDENPHVQITSEPGYEIATITDGAHVIPLSPGISTLHYPLRHVTQDAECQVEFRTAALKGVEIRADDDKPNNLFGGSVSVSGDDILVGAHGDNAAYVFTKEGDTWTQQAKLEVEGDVTGFGWPVSIDGDYALVGAWNSAYIFKRDGDAWSQQARLTADNEESVGFGSPVSLSGDHALIGDYSDNGFSGTAYVFRRNGISWEQQSKIAGNDTEANDMFGSSLALFGDYAVIGAYGYEGGTAYVFERNGDAWTEILKKSGTGYFSESLAISASGDHIAISNAEWPPLILNKSESGWYEADTSGMSGGFSGISMSDEYACAVSQWNNQAVLTKHDDGSWKDVRELYCPDDVKGFGVSVSVSGDYAVVGADNTDSSDGRGGRIYLFDLTELSENHPPFPESLNPVEKGDYTISWNKADTDGDAAGVMLYIKDDENQWNTLSFLKITENSGQTAVALSQDLESGIYRLGILGMHTTEHQGEGASPWITDDFVIGEMMTRTIIATAGQGGTISPSGEVMVSYGSTQTFEFHPDAGWYIENIFVDNEPAELTESYIFSNITQDHAIHADFADPNQKKGDVNADNDIGLDDLILCLQIASGIKPMQSVTSNADVNADDRIGLAEAVYLLRMLYMTD